MNNPNKADGTKAAPGQSDSQLRQAMIALGWLIPTTPDEVEIVESQFRIDQSRLPAALEDPMAVFDRPTKPIVSDPQTSCKSRNDAVDENLARAAREGKGITADTDERMRQDRDAAEKHDDRERQ